jgi:hypothetical protein
VETPEVNQPKKDTVAYETHQKLLSEKKKLQQEYEALKAEKQQREEAELTKRGEFEKVLKLREQEALELKTKLQEREQRELEARKLSAVLKGLGTSVDDKWFSIIQSETDDVVYNPESGEIEQMSVTKVVERLKAGWPEMFKKPLAGMPADAPKGNGAGTIARSEWLKLPAKEMAKWRPNQIV